MFNPFKYVFRRDEKVMMAVGGTSVVAGTVGLLAVPANAVLSTTATMTYVAAGGVPQVVPLVTATGWGVVASLSKVAIGVGAGCFLYGFGKGLYNGVQVVRAEHRASKIEQGK
jgi:hypothetical protein